MTYNGKRLLKEIELILNDERLIGAVIGMDTIIDGLKN